MFGSGLKLIVRNHATADTTRQQNVLRTFRGEIVPASRSIKQVRRTGRLPPKERSYRMPMLFHLHHLLVFYLWCICHKDSQLLP